MLSWDAGEASQAVPQYVEDEVPQGGPNIPAHFSTALDEDETPSIHDSDTAVPDGLLAMRLLRHFKEGPGQW